MTLKIRGPLQGYLPCLAAGGKWCLKASRAWGEPAQARAVLVIPPENTVSLMLQSLLYRRQRQRCCGP